MILTKIIKFNLKTMKKIFLINFQKAIQKLIFRALKLGKINYNFKKQAQKINNFFQIVKYLLEIVYKRI